MKNIHVLPTQNEIISKLFKVSNELKLTRKYDFYNGAKYQNIYITSDEEIKEEDWVITPTNDIIQWAKVFQPIGKKIILTTDAYLIKDDVQAIDDEFLEWFVKNPSCEWVEVEDVYKKFLNGDKRSVSDFRNKYKIIIPKEVDMLELGQIIPKEVPKQETLEEAAEKYDENDPNDEYGKSYRAFIEGVKWQQERSYSEEEVYNIIQQLRLQLKTGVLKWQDDFEFDLSEWFEQFSKLKNG